MFGVLVSSCHFHINSRSQNIERYEPIVVSAKAATQADVERKLFENLQNQVRSRLPGCSTLIVDEMLENIRLNAHTFFSYSPSDKNQWLGTEFVDTRVLTNNLIDEVRKEYDLHRQQIDKSEKLIADGSDGYEALRLALSSLRGLAEIEKKIELIKALNHQDQTFVPTPTKDELIQKITNWIAELRIKTTFGDDQRVLSGQVLWMPIGIQAYWLHNGIDIPLPGLPIRFYSPGEEEKPIATDNANALGIASANIHYVPTPTSKLFAGIDGQKIFSDIHLPPNTPKLLDLQKRLEAISTNFVWHVQADNVSRILLSINQNLSNQTPPEDQTDAIKELINILEDNGYYIQVSHELLDATKQFAIKQLATRFKNQADYIVVGQIDSEIKTIAEGLVFAITRGKIQVVNLSTESILITIEDISQGAGQDAYSAELRSIANFFQRAKPDLIKTLKTAVTSSAP